jgi:uncharacterized protein (DUF433 family)
LSAIQNQFDWSRVGGTGLYTVPLAAKLIGADQTRLRAWVEGYPHGARPIIHRQIPPVAGRTVLGFLDLMEARFIRHFQAHGFSPQTIRKVSGKLRTRHDVDHPFAMNKRFRTDGRAIFMESAETNDERIIINLMNDNFEMGDIIAQSLFDSVFYIEDMAAQWSPLKDSAPLIIIHPKVSFGMPVVKGYGIPTSTIYKSYLAEGNACLVAEDFDIEVDALKQAVIFEQEVLKGTIH